MNDVVDEQRAIIKSLETEVERLKGCLESQGFGTMQYCSLHESSWIPFPGSTVVSASCPWCQRDKFYDAVENIRDVFSDAVRAFQNKGVGGQQVSYHGDFANIAPSVVGRMQWWIRAWDEILGRNVRRGK